MEEWKQYRLIDVLDTLIDYRGKTPKKTMSGIPLITAKIIKNGRIETPTEFISVDDYDSWMVRGFPKVGDVVLTTEAPLGEVAQLDDANIALAQRVVTLRGKSNVLDNTYLKYYFLSNVGKQRLKARETGTTVTGIKQSELKEVLVDVPPFEVQVRIAEILKSLDDKIEVNRRINDNLEQQAQALFKSWFVDFEPFRDGEFVESELGLIPKGWRVGTLGEICSQSSLKVGSRNDVKVLSPVTTGNLMLSEEYFTKQVFSESIVKYKVVKKGAFAYNPARVNIGSLGRNEYDFDGAVSPVYVVFECKEGYSNFFDLFRTTERFKTEVLLRSIGGVRQSLNYVDFAMIQTIIAPKDVVDAFNPIMEEIQVMQKHLAEENDRLATLRDTLLPKLMSGELKVFDKPNDQS